MLSRVAFASLPLACAFACNIFTSLDRCASDAECPNGTTCDPHGRFCISANADAMTDATADTAPNDADAGSSCDPSRPFSTPQLVAGLEDVAIFSARFDSSETTAMLAVVNGPNPAVNIDLCTASRLDRAAPFKTPVNIPVVNTPASAEYWPTLSANGLLLFFESDRSLQKVDGGHVRDQARIWSATRVSIGADFTEPSIDSTFALPPASWAEAAPFLHPNGKSLYFTSFARESAGGNGDIYVAKLNEFGLVDTVERINEVRSRATDLAPVVTLDETTLYYGRSETTSSPSRDVYVSRRASAAVPFGAPARVDELSTPSDEFASWASDDGCRLYFISNRATGREGGTPAAAAAHRLWVAERR